MPSMQARVVNTPDGHEVTVSTNGQSRVLSIAAKVTGRGSSANGAELLFLALATCACNDLFREAANRHLAVQRVEVIVEGDFGSAPGSRAENVRYHVTVQAAASEAEIRDLIAYTDTVAEIQNTLRAGVPVTLDGISAVPVVA